MTRSEISHEDALACVREWLANEGFAADVVTVEGRQVVRTKKDGKLLGHFRVAPTFGGCDAIRATLKLGQAAEQLTLTQESDQVRTFLVTNDDGGTVEVL